MKVKLIFRFPWKHLPHAVNKHKLKLHSHAKYIALLIDEILSWNKEIAGHILICAIVVHTRMPFSKTVNFVCLCAFLLFCLFLHFFPFFSPFSFFFGLL